MRVLGLTDWLEVILRSAHSLMFAIGEVGGPSRPHGGNRASPTLSSNHTLITIWVDPTSHPLVGYGTRMVLTELQDALTLCIEAHRSDLCYGLVEDQGPLPIQHYLMRRKYPVWARLIASSVQEIHPPHGIMYIHG